MRKDLTKSADSGGVEFNAARERRNSRPSSGGLFEQISVGTFADAGISCSFKSALCSLGSAGDWNHGSLGGLCHGILGALPSAVKVACTSTKFGERTDATIGGKPSAGTANDGCVCGAREHLKLIPFV